MLKDNGHTILRCSDCRIALVDIWHTQSELILESTIRAKCDYCGGESPEVKTQGGIYLGSTDDSVILDIKNLDTENEESSTTHQSVLVTTSKGK